MIFYILTLNLYALYIAHFYSMQLQWFNLQRQTNERKKGREREFCMLYPVYIYIMHVYMQGDSKNMGQAVRCGGAHQYKQISS